MKNYKNTNVSWNEYKRTGRYYDPVEKIEKEGEIPPHGLIIGDPDILKFRVTYRVSREAVKEIGTLVSRKEIPNR